MATEATPKGQLSAAEPLILTDAVQYATGSIVSRTLLKGDAGTLTLFAFDGGQALSEHTAPFDAVVQVLDGTARLTIAGKAIDARTGDLVLMPANVPHGVQAASRFKMLLTMFKTAGKL